MRFYLPLCIATSWLVTSEAFSSNSNFKASPLLSTSSSTSSRAPLLTTIRSKPLYLFGNKKNNDDDDVDADTTTSKTSDSTNNNDEEKPSRIPFFGRIANSFKEKVVSTASEDEDSPAVVPAASTVSEEKAKPPSSPPPPPPPPAPENPMDVAKSLRAQAERARLEAEKMDAELTLNKIEKLERQLVTAKAKGDSVEDLQRQLDNLQAKMRGEAPKPIVIAPVTTTTKPKEEEEEKVAQRVEAIKADSFSPPAKELSTTVAPSEPTESYEDFLTNWNITPDFLKKAEALAVEVDFDTVADIDSREIYNRMEMMKKSDFSFSKKAKPTFTQAQIDAMVEEINNPKLSESVLPEEVLDNYTKMAEGNTTKLAEYVLEYDWYVENKFGDAEEIKESFVKIMQDEEWMQPVLDAINQTTVDRTIESFYPKCTRKEDGVEPTLAQVQSLASNVLPGARFSATSKPEKVLGGYIIRGQNKNENGDDLISAIDKGLERSNLADKMTVLFTPDWTFVAQLDEVGDDADAAMVTLEFEDSPGILYITGPDIVRDRKRVLLSLTSATGIATSWYLSIYPFLLNPTISKRVEDQVALADASMAYDLNWLTDLSVPLFVAYLGIVAAHELAHRLIAAFYEIETSVPTLVPSIITGTTSTVTTFKAPPKNYAAMFDYALAGPLAGVATSCVALFLGSQLTASSDPAFLPSLPVDILRQSSLGGGIIDSILQGILYVPDGAPTDGIMIALHPLAIAGYIGLIGNALALLPIGTTDGGRIGLALFGRPGKLLIGNLALFGLLFSGLFGSDLYLFYFSFVIAFQTGNEIPARNEVDKISFPRVIAATVAYCIAILSLVPFQ